MANIILDIIFRIVCVVATIVTGDMTWFVIGLLFEIWQELVKIKVNFDGNKNQT